MQRYSSRSFPNSRARSCRWGLYTLPFAIVGLAPFVAEAAEINVDTTADAIDQNGDCSLREAVIAANTNAAVDGCAAGEVGLDTINVPAGTYTLSLTGADEGYEQGGNGYQVNVTADASIGDLDITESLTIAGAGAADTIIEWANDEDRIFHIQAPVDDVVATISGLTIQGGSVPAMVVNPNDPPDMQYRFARHGGAVAVGVSASAKLVDESGPSDQGNSEEQEPTGTASLVMTACILTDSSAGGDGGALYAAGPVTLTGVTISSNTADGNGGGVYNDGEATYDSCLISQNHGENGGGMFDTGSHGTSMTGTTFAGNTGVGGAGLASRALVDTTLVNCTFSGNEASDIGGGILTNGSVSLQNSTIYGNIALSDAGWASAGLTTFGSGGFALQSSLVGGNAVGENLDVANCGCTGGSCDPADSFTSDGFNLEDVDTCVFTQDTDQIETDPMAMDLGSYGGPVPTHALMAGSPALDTASVEDCPELDARGIMRPEGAGCDVGAFELAPDELDSDEDGYCVGVLFDETPMCLDGSMTGDCDGSNPDAFPGNPEVCDGADNDCNDMIDDGLETADFWPDSDGDGFGDASADPTAACMAPEGFTDNASDCDDAEGDVNPDAEEVCGNNIDDNCNDMVDEDCPTGDGDGDPTGDGDGDPAGDGDGDGDTGETGETGDDPGADGDDGCNCSTEPSKSGGFGWLALLGLGLVWRRRRG